MLVKGLCLFFLGVGVFTLVQVVMPVLVFKAWEIAYIDKSQVLIDPLSGTTKVLGVSVKNVGNFPSFTGEVGLSAPYSEFRLSIPSINLSNIQVMVNSNEFETHLSHLPGSALPGEKGNAFITGHSSISAFASRKNSQSFFTNLPKIRKGEMIITEVLGQKFSYEVIGIKVVDPKDVSVINPPDGEGRYISLMTCVPPGFNTKRLIVLAKLI